MAMDLLRSVNLTRTRIFSNSGREVWVRWYITAPDAPAYPGVHAFGHPVWESFPNEFEGPGCFGTPLVWRPNSYPRPDPPYTPIGTAEDFRLGILFPPAPVVEGCGGPGIEAFGGFDLSGSAFPVHGVIFGGAHAADRTSLLIRVLGRITGGAVTSATITEGRRTGVITGGGHPATAITPRPTYIVTASIVGGATINAGHGVGGAYSAEAYSAAWDRPH